MSQTQQRQADLIHRLRVRPPSSWSDARVTLARQAVQELADLAADASGEPRRTVPHLHPMALADQLGVLLADAADAGVRADDLEKLFERLAAGLAVR